MTKYDKSVIDNVFKLYSLGKPIERISKEVGVSRTQIYKWRKNFDWNNRSDEINAKAQKKIDETITDIKHRQHLLLKSIMAKFTEQISDKNKNPFTQVKVSPNELVTTLKHELLLFGEPETKTEVSGVITAESLADMYEEIYGDSKKTD